MVLPPPRPFGKADMFVDDGNAITLDVDNNTLRAQVGVFKSTEVSERLYNNEVIPRDPHLQGPKNDDMGRPKEIKLVLGWIVNTRALLMSQPQEKCAAWSADIAQAINKECVSKNHLERMIGRLSHAATDSYHLHVFTLVNSIPSSASSGTTSTSSIGMHPIISTSAYGSISWTRQNPECP
jgi:hypothetical protein